MFLFTERKLFLAGGYTERNEMFQAVNARIFKKKKMIVVESKLPFTQRFGGRCDNIDGSYSIIAGGLVLLG